MRSLVAPSFLWLSKPAAEALITLDRLGIRLVELLANRPQTHADLSSEASVDALADVMQGLAIRIHTVHSGFSCPADQGWDISLSADAVASHAVIIGASVRLGARQVIVHPGVAARGTERLSTCRASLERLTEIAREAGIMIAVENLPPDYLGGSVEEMRRILDGTDPNVVGFCLDTGHAMTGRDPVPDYIHALGDRLISIHWHGNNGIEDQHLCPTVGGADWSEFFKALDRIGYDQPITVESYPPEDMPLEEVVLRLNRMIESGAG